MSNDTTSTEELKQQIANGDIEALSLLYGRYYTKLKLYGQQFAPQLESYSIEDSIQELFIWITKNYKKLSSIDNLEVYLFSALKRNAMKDIGSNNRRQSLKDRYLNRQHSETKKPSVEIRYIETENRLENTKYVNQLLDSLPAQQKEVLYLRNYMNMKFKEIAEVMNLTEQVVRNYNYRAIKHLRAKPQTKLNNL